MSVSSPPDAAFRFLHAADLHLDSPLRGLVRRGEAAGAFIEASRRALENLVSAAIAEQAAFLVIAGDVYDGDWRDYATGQFFVRQMGRLARAGIRVFVIRGNHDAESVITRSLPLPDNVHSFSVRTVETVLLDEFRVALHGRGFANRHVPDNVALSYPPARSGYFNIGVLHTSLTGREGHDVYAPCAVEDLRRAGYDYWALGHVHRREVVAEDPPIVFPGNLQGRHARETGPKGATLVSVAGGRVARMEALALDAARFAHVGLDLSGVAEPAELLRQAGRVITEACAAAEGRPLALRLTLTGETALHDRLAAHPAEAEQEMQALAWEAGADVLVEKLRIETASPRAAGGGASGTASGAASSAGGIGGLAGFDAMLAEVAADPAFRAEIARTLADLRGKAPPDALALLGDEGADAGAVALSAIARAQGTVLARLHLDAAAPPEQG